MRNCRVSPSKQAMDFHSIKRKRLQRLCKKNNIPFHTTNKAMADALKSLMSISLRSLSLSKIDHVCSPVQDDADLISHLPPEIKAKILEFLPVKQAVRSSILSTEWRDAWSFISKVSLPFFPPFVSISDQEEYSEFDQEEEPESDQEEYSESDQEEEVNYDQEEESESDQEEEPESDQEKESGSDQEEYSEYDQEEYSESDQEEEADFDLEADFDQEEKSNSGQEKESKFDQEEESKSDKKEDANSNQEEESESNQEEEANSDQEEYSESDQQEEENSGQEEESESDQEEYSESDQEEESDSDQEYSESEELEPPVSIQFVDRFLQLHKGSIFEAVFEMKNPDLFEFEDPDLMEDPNLTQETMKTALDHWIHILSRKGIRKLTITQLEDYIYEIPSYFYTFHLETLVLVNCGMNDVPASFTGFPLLKTLNLISVEMTGGYSVKDLITQSPKLEYIKLCRVESEDQCEIYAPNLKDLEINEEQMGCRIYMNAPNLVSARLDLFDILSLTRSRMPNVEQLVLRCRFARVLTFQQSMQALLHMRFNNLKKLEMIFDATFQNEIDFVLAFLKTTPNLEKLCFYVDYLWGDHASDLISSFESNLTKEFDSLQSLQLEEVEEEDDSSILHVRVIRIAETQN